MVTGYHLKTAFIDNIIQYLNSLALCVCVFRKPLFALSYNFCFVKTFENKQHIAHIKFKLFYFKKAHGGDSLLFLTVPY